MAGRGRGGRGRGMSFSVESLGFGRGDSIPGSILQPPALFPPLEFQAVPLLAGEEYEYLLALKQEFRGTIRESPYHIKPNERKKDISRYSDKYQLAQQEGANSTWQPDWSLLPMELHEKRIKRKQKSVRAPVKPKLPLVIRTSAKAEDITQTLNELEKKEESEDKEPEEEEGKEEPEGEENEEDEYADEDDMEEETDYNLTYFDGGDTFGDDDDDDLDEGPTY